MMEEPFISGSDGGHFHLWQTLIMAAETSLLQLNKALMWQKYTSVMSF